MSRETTSAVSDSSSVSESRRRQIRRDEAIRRRIDLEFSKKRRTPTKPRVPRRGLPGSVLALKPSEPVTCRKSTTIYEVSQLMLAKRCNCVLVVDEHEKLLGLFTTKDLAFRVVGGGLDANLATVGQVMTSNPLTSSATSPASQALDLMLEHRFRHMPVEEDSNTEIVGVLDIVTFYKKHMKKFERLNTNSARLFDTLDVLHNDLGVESNPPHIEEYLESLRNQVNGPTIQSVVGDVSRPVFASLKATVYDVANMMKVNNTSVVLIRDGSGKVVGIVSSKDVTFRAIAAGLNPKICSVVRVMTANPDVVNTSTTIRQALKQMLDGNYLNLPVEDSSQSIIAVVDVLSLIHATLQNVGPSELEPDGSRWNNFWTMVDDELEIGRSANDSGELNSFLAEIRPSDSVSHTASPIKNRVPSFHQTQSTTGSESVFDSLESFAVKVRTRTKIFILPVHDDLNIDNLVSEISLRAKCPEESIILSYLDEDGDRISLHDKTDLLQYITRHKAKGKNKVDVWVDSVTPTKTTMVSSQWIIPAAFLIAASAVVVYTLQRRR